HCGAADSSVNIGTLGQPVGGAHVTGDHLENGGMEWMYFADSLYPLGGSISSKFAKTEYPDVQQGRFLQMGHKVPHIYGIPGQPDLPPYGIPPVNPDVRPPYPGVPPINPGIWRGAFGPKGPRDTAPCIFDGQTNHCPLARYRSPGKPGSGLRMSLEPGSGPGFNYSDPFVVVRVEEWGPPLAPTATNTPTSTNTFTPSNTPTFTASRTPSNTR